MKCLFYTPLKEMVAPKFVAISRVHVHGKIKSWVYREN